MCSLTDLLKPELFDYACVLPKVSGAGARALTARPSDERMASGLETNRAETNQAALTARPGRPNNKTATNNVGHNRKATAGLLALLNVSPATDLANGIWFKSTLLRWFWILYAQHLTKAGRWFLWPTLFFTSYASISLSLGAYLPFCYAAGLWGMAVLSAFIWRPRIQLTAHVPDRVGVGARLAIEVEVENTGSGPARDWFVLPHRLPPGIESEPVLGCPLPTLPAKGRARGTIGLICDQRGSYRLSGYRVESEFPSGLLRSSRTSLQPHALLVYPRFTALTRLDLPMGRRYQPGGVALASVVGESMEYMGNREYRDGDNVRNIDWHATARLDKLIVREYREEYFFRVGVILDTRVPLKAPAERTADFERAVSMAAAVSDAIARREHLVDLFAAGPHLFHLTAGRSLAYMDQILDILACVEAHPAEPFEILEPEIAENLAKITTVIGLFLDWDEPRRAFIRRIQEQGVGVKVIVIRDAPCTLEPSAEGDGFDAITVISRTDFEGGVREL